MMQLPDSRTENIQPDFNNDSSTKYLIFDDDQWLYIKKCFNLTTSEKKICELMCQGLSEGEIAIYMNIKRGTVKTHARNIYRKMHVKNKVMMLLDFIKAIREQA